MKIKNLETNYRKKCFTITLGKKVYSLPFAKLETPPSVKNRVTDYFIEKDGRAVVYTLESGDEDGVHLDYFLDYNKDPDYLLEMLTYNLSIAAQEAVKKSKLSKREIARKLHTSPTALLRLLDQNNYNKTINQMIKLFLVLNFSVEIKDSDVEYKAKIDQRSPRGS